MSQPNFNQLLRVYTFLEKSALGTPEKEVEEFQESRKLLNLDEKLIKRTFSIEIFEFLFPVKIEIQIIY